MMGLLVGVMLLVIILLIFAAAIVIRPSKLSSFELKRLGKISGSGIEGEVIRTQHLADLVSLQRIITSLLLVSAAVVFVALCGWIVGIILGVALALGYGAIARIPFIQKTAQKWYEKFEPSVIGSTEKYPKVFSLLRTVSEPHSMIRINSEEELLHIVQQSYPVLTHDQISSITHGIHFSDEKVSKVMVPKNAIEGVSKAEILGPFVLDDLHKTGHSWFPVVDQDIDHVVGILYLGDVLRVDGERSHTAKVESVMRPEVFYIRQDQTLEQALAAFLRTHHHLLIVVNEKQETMGLLSLEDLVKELVGRKINDTFDEHGDLKKVAERR